MSTTDVIGPLRIVSTSQARGKSIMDFKHGGKKF